MITKISRIFIKIYELSKWPFLFKSPINGVKSLFYKFTKQGLKEIILKNGLRIYCSGTSGDMDIFRETFVQSYFNNKYIDYKKISTALDIGANKGFVTLMMLWNNPNIKIISIEPDSRNIKYLAKNIEKNGFKDNVTIINQAVWIKDGQIDFYKTGGYHQGNSIFKEHLSYLEKIIEKVPCTTIDSIISKHGLTDIEFIKIDVEGAEYEIIFNLKSDFIEKIKYFHIECHKTTKHEPDEMVKFMKTRDFEIVYPYKGESQIICINKRYS